ncbi:MAG: type I methionyl aminopeptidase [Clostridia bacterium]|nr:type I methionyl aminopeptidase [Clostridia bacterium]
MITIKSASQIDKMKRAGEIVALTHELMKKNICDGVTTKELDRIAEEFIRSKGAIPSFKNYNGYPASICASINDVVIHGIPDNTRLKNGDIIGVDIGAYIDGYHGDSANTYGVGDISKEAADLIDAAKRGFEEGIKKAVAGNRVGDISSAIQQYVESRGYSIVREFVGHGVGAQMHEEPEVPNYGRSGHGPRLCNGMTLAVEPMINAGKRNVVMLDDDWTIVTEDGSLSAHYEHSIAITKEEPILLTVCR